MMSENTNSMREATLSHVESFVSEISDHCSVSALDAERSSTKEVRAEIQYGSEQFRQRALDELEARQFDTLESYQTRGERKLTVTLGLPGMTPA